VHRWAPVLPQWAWALVLMIALTLTNLYSVRSYGEFEFWFASIKVAAIVAFIVVGLVAILGLLPGVESPGTANLTDFLPHGAAPVLAAMLVVVFSFFGAEIATIAAGETDHPQAAIRAAVRSVVWRILLFYLGSVAVVVTLLPYDDAGVAKSPYVAVLERIGLPSAGSVMDVVVLTSVLSCLNSGLYTASRMAFSLAGRGEAPRAWRRLTRRGVPAVSVLVSTVVGFLTVILNYVSPDQAFLFLLNSSGAIALFVWLVIAVSHLRLRRRLEATEPERLELRMWAFPYLTYLTIAAIGCLLVAMVFYDSTRPQVLLSVLVAVVVVAVALARDRRRPARVDAAEPSRAISR
jgi:L-asparagine transporter-like permease